MGEHHGDYPTDQIQRISKPSYWRPALIGLAVVVAGLAGFAVAKVWVGGGRTAAVPHPAVTVTSTPSAGPTVQAGATAEATAEATAAATAGATVHITVKTPAPHPTARSSAHPTRPAPSATAAPEPAPMPATTPRGPCLLSLLCIYP